MKFYNDDCFKIIPSLSNSANLILTDPPYLISKETGFSSVKDGVERFAVTMDFGDWDKNDLNLTLMCKLFYDSLQKSGTVIIFFDIWKISYLKEAMETAGFRMIRLIVWDKSNPVPLNSKCNYLTNSREIALLGIKGTKPTFNSAYDTGNYRYPIENNGKRLHPTQKPLELMKDLIKKHSNEGDVVLDPFMGSGTTGVAALSCNRRFTGIEIDEHYHNVAKNRIENMVKVARKPLKREPLNEKIEERFISATC